MNFMILWYLCSSMFLSYVHVCCVAAMVIDINGLEILVILVICTANNFPSFNV